MRILYAVHHLPPRHTGGAENRAYRTARWMAAQGHQVSVICFERQVHTDWSDSVEHGISIRRLSLDRFIDASRIVWTFDEPRVEEHFRGVLRDLQPELVHVIGGYLVTAGGIRAALAAGVPVVITLTDFWFICPRITLLKGDGSVCPGPPADPMGCVQCLAEESRRYRLLTEYLPAVSVSLWRHLPPHPHARSRARLIDQRRNVLREVLLGCRVLICPSEFLRNKYVEQGVPGDRCVVMRQGHSLGKAPPKARPIRPFTFGYSGQIKPHKGVDLLLEAAARLSHRGLKFKVAIYGDQSETSGFVEALKARHQGDWLEWRGTYEADQTAEVMSGIDALIVPSRWYENSPNVILEAQAMRVPVVATRLGGMAELVRHDVDGLLFELNDPEDLARQLERLIAEKDLSNRLSASAPQPKPLETEMLELSHLYARISDTAGAEP